jgi:hypothetical protein
MAQLMPTSSITTNKLEELNFPPYSKNVMTNSYDEKEPHHQVHQGLPWVQMT